MEREQPEQDRTKQKSYRAGLKKVYAFNVPGLEYDQLDYGNAMPFLKYYPPR
jgi:hypothetical protein